MRHDNKGKVTRLSAEQQRRQRTDWMRLMQKRLRQAGGHPGKIDWYTATHLFNVGLSPVEAAGKIKQIQDNQVNPALLRPSETAIDSH